LGHLLSDEQFMYLNKIMETLRDAAHHERDTAPYEARKSVERIIKLITIPVYPLYKFHMKNLQSYYDVMSKKAIDLLNILYKAEDQIKDTYGNAYSNEGKLIFESTSNNRFKVYDDAGSIICDTVIDDDGIVEGKVKIISDEGDLQF